MICLVKQEKERKVTVNFVGDINPTEYVRKKVIQLMKEEENSFYFL